MNVFDDLKLTVGKHKNETFAYVYENDTDYCKSIVGRNVSNDSLYAFCNYVELRSYYEQNNGVIVYAKPISNNVETVITSFAQALCEKLFKQKD